MADTEQRNKNDTPHSDINEQVRAGDAMTSASKPNSKFSGQIFSPGISDNATKDRAISTAGYALQKALHPTPNHIWMAFFTCASCTKTTNPSGAYSVVFNQDTKLAKMAWYMSSWSDVVNEKRLAGLAIAQALYIADKRLRALSDNQERPKKATVKVFTQCVETLKNINDPSGIVGDGWEDQLEVIKLIKYLSYSLCNIVGTRVRLYLQWVPADYGKMVCARDFAKCCRRKSGRKNMSFVGNEKKDAGVMPEGVSGFIERDTAEEGQHDLLEQRGKIVAVAESVPASMVTEGQADVDQAASPENHKMDEEEVVVTDQVLNNEQASINQQILTDCYQY